MVAVAFLRHVQIFLLTYLLTRPAVGSEASTSVAHAGHVARRLITTRIRGFALMRYINP